MCASGRSLSSTSLLASATRVSHGMRWHQIFSEHAAKIEEWCPPGQRAGTLNWSSAAHKCREQKKNNQKEKLKNVSLTNAGEEICQFNLYFFSSKVKKKKKKSPSTCFLAEMGKVREGMKAQVREEGKNPLCAVFKLSRRRSEEHLPNLRSRSPGWKVGGKEQGSRTERERE